MFDSFKALTDRLLGRGSAAITVPVMDGTLKPNRALDHANVLAELPGIDDLAWDGQTMIYENGRLLASSERFPKGDRRSVADVDLDLLRAERLRMGTFDDNRRHHQSQNAFRRISFRLDPPRGDIGLRREVERFPFVPSDPVRLEQDCYEGYNIQVSGLEQRLRALDYPKVVIGVSGGLDSTHALIVAAKAMDREGRPRSDILAFTLPGFATGERTKNNAIALSTALGVSFSEIDIRSTAALMLTEIGHPYSRGEQVYDITFENVQAGLRTDYLFRLANQHGGLVVGTGDLSELALGWCTYGVGDHMSHYNPNGSVSKTLIQHLIRFVAGSGEVDENTAEVLRDVLASVKAQGSQLKATALNDYKVSLPVSDSLRFDVVLALRINGELISVRNKGPLFVVYPYDSDEELRSTLYYSRSIWQLKTIEVE
jgi:NAD+ synthetase